MKRKFYSITINFVITLISIVTGAALSSCVTTTYSGQHDSSAPIKEQVTLMMPSTLYNVRLDGQLVSGLTQQSPFGMALQNIKKIPPGFHTITADYKLTTEGQVLRTTTTAGGLEISFDFEPGHSYKIKVIRSSRYVSLSVENHKGSFFDGGYLVGAGYMMGTDNSTSDQRSNFVGLAADVVGGSFSPAGKTIWAFNFLDAGIALGMDPSTMAFAGRPRIGASADLYFGQKNILPGLGLGGGILLLSYKDGNDEKYKISPYARGTFTLRGKKQARLFVEYYFENQDDLLKQFGAGLLFAFM
jgi:hypothetical protein